MKPQANHRVFQTQQQQQTQNRTKGAWVGIVESQNTRPGVRADKARTLAHLDCSVSPAGQAVWEARTDEEVVLASCLTSHSTFSSTC